MRCTRQNYNLRAAIASYTTGFPSFFNFQLELINIISDVKSEYEFVSENLNIFLKPRVFFFLPQTDMYNAITTANTDTATRGPKKILSENYAICNFALKPTNRIENREKIMTIRHQNWFLNENCWTFEFLIVLKKYQEWRSACLPHWWVRVYDVHPPSWLLRLDYFFT